MKTVPYSIHVEEDVAHFLDQHKKRAGRTGSRGAYVSRAIRAYEEMIDEKDAMRSELAELDRNLIMMRDIARDAIMARNRFQKMFNQALNGQTPKIDDTPDKEWLVANRQMEEDITEKSRFDKYGKEVA